MHSSVQSIAAVAKKKKGKKFTKTKLGAAFLSAILASPRVRFVALTAAAYLSTKGRAC